jgi:hypothetical protein
MRPKSIDLPIVAFSVRVYQLLLVAYPTRFQQEYGPHMLQVFRDCCLRAIRQSGTNGMVRLWAITLLDFLRSVVEQHIQKETDMSKSKLIRLGGWTFILGSFAFITILSSSNSLTFVGSVLSSILLAAGLLSLQARYGENAGGFGRNILLVGVIGTVLMYVVFALLYLGIQVLSVIQFQAPEAFWILLYVGPAVALIGLTLFGLAALRSKPMARLNWLPVFAGIWYPVFYFFLAGYLFTNHGKYPGQYQTAFEMMWLVQFIALFALGIIQVADSPQEMAMA